MRRRRLRLRRLLQWLQLRPLRLRLRLVDVASFGAAVGGEKAATQVLRVLRGGG